MGTPKGEKHCKFQKLYGHVLLILYVQKDSSRRQSMDNLDIPLPVMKPSVDKLEAMEQQRRTSMQQRRASLVDLIPDWPTLQHREKTREVDSHSRLGYS